MTFYRILSVLFFLSRNAYGCYLCTAPAVNPDCPEGSVCDGTLFVKETLATGCLRYKCTAGTLLVKTSGNMQRQTDYLWCNTNRIWYDSMNRTGNTASTCVLSEEERKCSYPSLPDPIPPKYRQSGNAVYNKTTRTLKCTEPTAMLLTISKTGLGTKSDGCLHVDSALCADYYSCSTAYTDYHVWSATSDLAYVGKPTPNYNDFTVVCPTGQKLKYAASGKVYQADNITCNSGGVHKANGVSLPTDEIGCFVDSCTPLENSIACGEGKQCVPASIVNGSYHCPATYQKLVAVSGGSTKEGATLTCDKNSAKWLLDGSPVEECVSVRCEYDKCITLEPIPSSNTVFARDYRGQEMDRLAVDHYGCPSVSYEADLQDYVDYTYDMYAETTSGATKLGKSLSCKEGTNGTWGWFSENGTALKPTDRVSCGLKLCQFCVPESISKDCSGDFYAPSHSTTTNAAACTVANFACNGDDALVNTDSVYQNYRSGSQALTCQSTNWKTWKALYGSGATSKICCLPRTSACREFPTSCGTKPYDCQPTTRDTTAWTLTCPSGYGFNDDGTTTYAETSAKCGPETNYDWTTTTNNKKLVRTKEWFCKK